MDSVVTMRADVAALLIDVEAHLRQLDLWESESPPAVALASTQPFCVDTLTLPQWLQFIFLPRMYQLLDAGEPLPAKCGIAPIAEEYFPDLGPVGDQLLTALGRIDELLSGDAAT